MVLCADSTFNLQRFINILEISCKNWGLTVNLDKSDGISQRWNDESNENWWFECIELTLDMTKPKYL